MSVKPRYGPPKQRLAGSPGMALSQLIPVHAKTALPGEPAARPFSGAFNHLVLDPHARLFEPSTGPQ
jgi:hypothetical protein